MWQLYVFFSCKESASSDNALGAQVTPLGYSSTVTSKADFSAQLEAAETAQLRNLANIYKLNTMYSSENDASLNSNNDSESDAIVSDFDEVEEEAELYGDIVVGQDCSSLMTTFLNGPSSILGSIAAIKKIVTMLGENFETEALSNTYNIETLEVSGETTALHVKLTPKQQSEGITRLEEVAFGGGLLGCI